LANSNDRLICVDVFDRPVGSMLKMAAHQKGVLHRAFSVFLVSPDRRRMIIQQRAATKYHSGGLWANTCCSHPREGEETMAAARRRLVEETGIDCSLQEIFSFVYRHVFPDGLCEYEYDHVFIGFYEGCEQDWRPDPREIQAMAWIELDRLAEELRLQPEKFSPWFITAAPAVLAYLSSVS